MATPSGNIKFESLFKKFQENPTREVEEVDKKEIEALINAYLLADRTRDSEASAYNEITSFLNLFMDSYCKKYPEILNPSRAAHIINSKWITNEFPMMRFLSEYTPTLFEPSPEKILDDAQTKFLEHPLGTLLTSRQQDMLTVGPLYSENDPKTLMDVGYVDKINKLYEEATKKHGSALGKEKEREELIRAYYNLKRKQAIKKLMSLYGARNKEEANLFAVRNFSKEGIFDGCVFDVNSIGDIPHLCHPGQTTQPYPGVPLTQLLPHKFFWIIAQLQFNLMLTDPACTTRSSMLSARKHFFADILGRIWAEGESKRFKEGAYRSLRKSQGKEAGFILQSINDEQELWFVKHDNNTINEYVCAQLLTALGIKMPESELVIDVTGTEFLMTLNASRRYEKGGIVKEKRFQTLFDHLKDVAYVAFGENYPPLQGRTTAEQETVYHLEKDKCFVEQQHKMDEFVNHAMAEPKSRMSFAKLLLAKVIFGLADFGGHAGNIGLTVTKKGEKEYRKFYIVDFDFQPKAILPLETDILNYLKDFIAIPVVRALCEKLTVEDLTNAAKELASPKARTKSESGPLIFVALPTVRTTAENIIETTFNKILEELRTKLNPWQYEKRLKELQAMKVIINNNIATLLTHILKTTAESTIHLSSTVAPAASGPATAEESTRVQKPER